jgi:hypothetical protein
MTADAKVVHWAKHKSLRRSAPFFKPMIRSTKMKTKDDPFELVRLGLAKLSNLHPSHVIKRLCTRLGVQAVSDIAKQITSEQTHKGNST